MEAVSDRIALVDCHAHVHTLDMPLSGTAWHHPAHDATVEQYVATLDEHDVRLPCRRRRASTTTTTTVPSKR